MEILVTINIYGERDLRRAERFVNEYNNQNQCTLEFKRDYCRFRGSETLYEGPIFYIENVPLEKQAVTEVANLLKTEVENFYNSL